MTSSATSRLRLDFHHIKVDFKKSEVVLIQPLLSQTNNDFSNSAGLCYMETCLNVAIPDSSSHLANFLLIRADRDAESTGKSCGGGTCFYINERWCTFVTVLKQICCSDLEVLYIKCKPFYLPQEFCSFILVSASQT